MNDIDNSLLLPEDVKSNGEAKFNASWQFNMHLANLIAFGDNCYMQQNIEGWHKSLNCLYRNIAPYMDGKERKKVQTIIQLCSDFQTQQELRRKEYNRNPRRFVDYPIVLEYHNSLHKFDIFLKQVLKDHKLITPVKSATSALEQ